MTSGHPPGPGMGLIMCTCLVTGNMIGSGVFFLPSQLSRFGWIAIVAWLVTGAGSLMLAMVFARLAPAYPGVGGPYVYARRAFGEFPGFWVAWGYWLTVVISNAAVAVATVNFAGYFWEGARDNSTLRIVLMLAMVWSLTAIAARGATASGSVAVLTTIIKLVPLVLIATVGLFWADFSDIEFNPSGQSPMSALSTAAALTLFAFIGLESATVPADDVVNPKRTIPIATVGGTLIAIAVYTLGTLAVFGAVPPGDLASSSSPFADAATSMWGAAAGDVVAIAAIISALGTLNGFILLQGHMPRAAAIDGLFPHHFARCSERRVPIFGLVASSLIASACIFVAESSADGFELLLLLTTVTALVPYIFSAAAQLVLIKTDPGSFSGLHFAKDATIGALAFAYSVWTVYGGGPKATMWSFIALLLGIPVYVWLKWARADRTNQAGELSEVIG